MGIAGDKNRLEKPKTANPKSPPINMPANKKIATTKASMPSIRGIEILETKRLMTNRVRLPAGKASSKANSFEIEVLAARNMENIARTPWATAAKKKQKAVFPNL